MGVYTGVEGVGVRDGGEWGWGYAGEYGVD